MGLEFVVKKYQFGSTELLLQDGLELARHVQKEEVLITDESREEIYMILSLTINGGIFLQSRWQGQVKISKNQWLISKNLESPVSIFSRATDPVDFSKRTQVYRLGENDGKRI